jgi:uncharacterized RDD family membrane protein YckC
MTEPTTARQAPDPEPGPAPGMRFASPGSRLLAYIIDSVIQFLLVLLLGAITLVLALIFFPFAIVSSLAIVVVAAGYFPYFWAKSGQTPGMARMNIKVVRDADGGPVTAGAAILRIIGLWIGLSVMYIGVIWIFIDRRKRGWQDLLGGTVVVDLPSAVQPS